MNKFSEFFQKIGVFTGEVVSETKKTTWPEKDELVGSTVVVIISVVLLALFVGVCDKVLVVLLKWLISIRG